MEQNFKNFIKTNTVSKNQTEIITEATFLDGTPLEIFLVSENGEFFLTDNKCIMKYMNKLYELTSKDVKNCIGAVLKIHGFKMKGGEIVAPIINSSDVNKKIIAIMQCAAELANMFVFFDKPA